MCCSRCFWMGRRREIAGRGWTGFWRLWACPTGGQQQRVAIARALIGSPEILFADEPTGNLDSRTGEEIMNLLGEINRDQGQTILMVTHSPEAAGRSSRVITVRDGVIV